MACTHKPDHSGETTLKEASSIPIGVGVNYDLLKNNTSYAAIVKTQFDRVTPGYQMKHAANVKNDGTYDFTKTDDFMNITSSLGVKVHGHTLAWYQNDNATYLNTLDTAQVGNALHDWVTTMVTRYKGRVTGWDVVNEAIADGTGALRTSANSLSGSGYFFWADYLGRDYIANAFTWAHAADPEAKLFINDYGLESNSRKLDSLIAMVNRLKADGVPIHGIGCQMHMSIYTRSSGIDSALQLLAATGLLIHVSELDVRINPGNLTPFTTTPALLALQAQQFRYVAESYFRNVPAAQRYGITVWDLTDADSWIVKAGNRDAPTLWDSSYNKKPVFDAFRKGLQ